MKCGDICLVQYPFTDGSAAKLRPVLIVSADQFNNGEDIVVLPLTSNPNADEDFCVVIEDNDPNFNRTGLKQSSAIKCTKPLTISKRLFKRKLGAIHPSITTEVRTILADVFSIHR